MTATHTRETAGTGGPPAGEDGSRRIRVAFAGLLCGMVLTSFSAIFVRLRVGFESHAARANLRTRSMTEAA